MNDCSNFVVVRNDRRITSSKRNEKVGDNLTLLCRCENEVRWSKRGETLPLNVIIKYYSQKSTSQLVMVDATLANSGIYVCEGEDHDYLIFEEEISVTISGMVHTSIITLYYQNTFI